MTLSLGADLILSLNGSAYTVTRSPSGSYVNGIWVGGTATEVEIIATVMPLAGADVISLPEGERTRERVKIYTATELKIKNETTGATSDTLAIDGKTFQVENVQKWAGYFKVIAVKIEGT